MEAQSVDAVPRGANWHYEPKWDGFRCLVFRDGDEVQLQSKSGQPLTRYFPEIVAAVRALPSRTFALDGELVIPADAGLSFDALLQRIHPAGSRVKKLAADTPARLIVFDLLADQDGRSILDAPLSLRRERLERFAADNLTRRGLILLSPATTRLAEALAWLEQSGDALDGIVAKRRDLGYRSGDRSGMQKIKNYRSADCVVGGFRYGEGRKTVGSLLLGLYDEAGLLHHVGFTSGLRARDKEELTEKLEALVAPPGFTGSAPGGPSRWSSKRSSQWLPLRPSLVVEVAYDHFAGGRFRHGTRLLRWRPDKAPAQCRLQQVTKARGADPLRLLD